MAGTQRCEQCSQAGSVVCGPRSLVVAAFIKDYGYFLSLVGISG